MWKYAAVASARTNLEGKIVKKAQVQRDFAMIQRFMIKDLERGIRDAKANYPVVLGLFPYLEVVGGWIIGNDALKGSAQSNFNAAITQMDPGYQALDAKMEISGSAVKGD
jgi:hypothetical protein